MQQAIFTAHCPYELGDIVRQISNILSITADTDTNIKACMQSITEIADDLERGSYGKEEKKQESNTIPTGKDIDI